jgi:6-phosphogluconolactonase (cycloisomerase 2 family)
MPQTPGIERTTTYILLAILLTACGGGGGDGSGPPHSVGGTVSGLTGSGLVLLDNGADSLAISKSGTFTFATDVAGGAAYDVTVSTQPSNPSQTCTVSHGSGTISGSDVTNVAVACTTNTYAIGGTISGLAGSGLVLALNGTKNPPISSGGSFTLTPSVASGATYSVTVATQPTNPPQTCALSNASGTVQASNITNVTVTCTTNTYSVGGYVAGLAGSGLALSYNGGAPQSISRNGYFALSTGVGIGTTYSVAITSQPTGPAQVCTLSNGSGAVGTTNVVSISVFCPQAVARFAYVANAGDEPIASSSVTLGSISQFSIDPSTGALTAVSGGTIATGPQVYSLQFVPHSHFLWALNSGNLETNAPGFFLASIYDYAVDPTTGLLTNVSGSPFATLDGTSSTPGCSFNGFGTTAALTFAPGGTYGYLDNTDEGPALNGGVSEFTVDPSSGAPTLVAGSQLPQCIDSSVTVDASGQFAYVVGRSQVSGAGAYMYDINATSGALTEVAGSPAFSGITPLITDPAGHFAYEADDGIYVYQIDPGTGALTQIAASPFSSGAENIVIGPQGRYAYVVNGSFAIVVYSIDATTGALTQTTNPPVALTTGGNPEKLVIDPSGQFLFTIAQTGSGGAAERGVFVYSIDATTGALSSVPGSPFDLVSVGIGVPIAVTVTN